MVIEKTTGMGDSRTTFFQCLNFNLVPSNGGDKIASVLILQDLLGKLGHGLFPLFLDSLLAWLGVVVDEGVQDDGSGHLEVPVGKEWHDQPPDKLVAAHGSGLLRVKGDKHDCVMGPEAIRARQDPVIG